MSYCRSCSCYYSQQSDSIPSPPGCTETNNSMQWLFHDHLVQSKPIQPSAAPWQADRHEKGIPNIPVSVRGQMAFQSHSTGKEPAPATPTVTLSFFLLSVPMAIANPSKAASKIARHRQETLEQLKTLLCLYQRKHLKRFSWKSPRSARSCAQTMQLKVWPPGFFSGSKN